MQDTSSAERQSYNARDSIGRPARYSFGGKSEPVRYLGIHRAQPIILFSDGRIEVVSRERVRLS
jgi:hypothetical protein